MREPALRRLSGVLRSPAFMPGSAAASVAWRCLACAVAVGVSACAPNVRPEVAPTHTDPFSGVELIGELKEFAEALGGLPVSKIHCSVLASDAIKEVLKGF